MSRQNITFAIFDVRPVNQETGQTDFDFINGLNPVVDLWTGEMKIFADEIEEQNPESVETQPPPQNDLPEPLAVFGPEGVASRPYGAGKSEILSELEISLSGKLNLKKEVKAFGGMVIDSPSPARPKPLRAQTLKKEEGFELDNLKDFRKEFFKIMPMAGPEEVTLVGAKTLAPPPYLPWASEIDALRRKTEHPRVLNLSPAARELDAALEDFKIAETRYPAIPVISGRGLQDKTSKSVAYFASFLGILFILTFFGVRALNIKTSVVHNSNQAYLNLSLARESLSESNFFEAASSFVLAARNFELLQEDLGQASALFKVMNTITLGGVSNVSKLVEAGELLSRAGADLGHALEKINQVNLISMIQGGETNILDVLGSLRLDFVQAGRNINQAGALLSVADLSVISESERQKFEELNKEIPRINEFMAKAADYSEALTVILGRSSPQRYLVLFQNTSELRPTGGFPGSYALVEFDKGVMKQFFVDDIYNPDGQMKEKIVPPKPLQRITPNWGLRDSAWFPDFAVSARKAAEFYYKDTKVLVDGVIAVNVDLVPELLNITGPIEMSDFGVTLNSGNFLAEVQEEVEYLKTKGQPKEILVDFAPKLMERLSVLDRDGWIKVFALLVEAVEKKDILAYFAAGRLQNFAVANGLSGRIEETDSDYLMVVHSNVMGSKTDAVIDNSIYLNVERSDGSLVHTLEIERRHNGGKLGFYNKRNNDYVRVMLPSDAELIGIAGNDHFDISPVVNYSQSGFISDPDLERYESRAVKTGDLEIFNDLDKKVFAFWMVIEPGQTKKAVLRYKTLPREGLYVQKQPGAKSSLKVGFEGKILFDEKLSLDKNIVLE